MRVTILGSGSKGNATLIEGEGVRVLVDAGLSPRVLEQRARGANVAPLLERLDAVVVTHAHSDHARYAEDVAARAGCPLSATESALRGMHLRGRAPTQVFGPDTPFDLGPLRVRPMRVPHDAPQVALVLEIGESRVGIVTDLGHVPEELPAHLFGCDTLLLESNHDPDMLARGPYPEPIKRRVRGPRGHLCNEQAAELLAKLGRPLVRVVLMHLSEKNNLPGLARAVAERALTGRGVELRLADQERPLVLPPLAVAARAEMRAASRP